MNGGYGKAECAGAPAAAEAPRPPLWSPASVRLRVAIALALALSVEGLMRSNINMAMVCMVNETALQELAAAQPPRGAAPSAPGETVAARFVAAMGGMGVRESPACANRSRFGSSGRKTDVNGDLVITKSEQASIFTSFYLGGLIAIMPGGYLCARWGSRAVVFYGALVNVLGSLATPFVARQLGATALTILRFIMGCGQGVLVPCMHVLVTYWFPLGEKSTALAITTTGNQISVVVAMFLTAELCQFSWMGGWASAFYLYGLVGIVLCAMWLCWVADTPARAKNIQMSELKYIESDETTQVGRRKDPVPWRKILTSLVVWSASMSSFSHNFMVVGTVVYLPTYYRNVLGMDISSNGLMSALPFVVQFITKIIFTSAADALKVRGILSHSAVVKLFNLIASIGSGICFLLLAFCDCTQAGLAITLAITAMGLGSGFIPGYNISVVCMAPRYASSIASFSRLLGQVASVAAPYMIGTIVVKGVRDEWQLAFIVMALLLISTGILFQCCGSAVVQDWAKMPRGAVPPLLGGGDCGGGGSDDDIALVGGKARADARRPPDIVKIAAAASDAAALLEDGVARAARGDAFIDAKPPQIP